MLNLYQLANQKEFRETKKVAAANWLSLVDPSDEEVELVAQELKIEKDYLRAALDRDEGARCETEDGQTLIIFDVPMTKKQDINYTFETLPLAIIITKEAVVTVTLENNAVIKSLLKQPPKNILNQKCSRFALQIIFRSMRVYLEYLKKIDSRSRQVETALYESLQNSELIKMLELQKSLVYFTTSLQSTESMLNKFSRLSMITKDEDNQDLFEDVLVESHQALEMANIYSNTLSGVMDAFASIISNNQNLVMKTLTVVTVVISIPTLIFSFYGMNVNLPFDQIEADVLTWVIPVIIALFCTLLTVGFLWKKKSL
ncbi:MAG: magnesium transporter CorA family protein [bacterium]|nr:magnesium transporter CorA family protein [bacterium]